MWSYSVETGIVQYGMMQLSVFVQTPAVWMYRLVHVGCARGRQCLSVYLKLPTASLVWLCPALVLSRERRGVAFLRKQGTRSPNKWMQHVVPQTSTDILIKLLFTEVLIAYFLLALPLCVLLSLTGTRTISLVYKGNWILFTVFIYWWSQCFFSQVDSVHFVFLQSRVFELIQYISF